MLISENTGRTPFYKLATEGTLVGFLKDEVADAVGGTFYHRVIASDGSNLTYSELDSFKVKITTEPNVGPIQILAPDYKFNSNYNVFASASNGHGITVDRNNRIWFAPFASTGLRVTNTDGSPYRPTSDSITIADVNGFPTITNLLFNGESVSIGSVRGMGLDEEGFILLVNNSRIYRLNPETGDAVARWIGPTSLTNATVDENGRVFVASVVGNQQFILERDGSSYSVVVGGDSGFELPNRELARSSAISKDGNWIVIPANSGENIHVYKSENGVDFTPYEVVETGALSGTNSIVNSDEDAGFYYLTNRTTNPATLIYRDFTNEISWQLPLEEISSTDQRGIAFTEDRSRFYTISSANGGVLNFNLDSEAPDFANATSYSVDEAVVREGDGTPSLEGDFVRVSGVINSQNFSISGLDFSFEANDKGMLVYKAQNLSNFNPQKGDSIAVFGTIRQSLELVQIVADSIEIVQANAREVETRTVSDFSEDFEALPIRLENLKLTGDWGTEESYFGFATSAEKNGTSFPIFVDEQSPVFNLEAPDSLLEISGILRKTMIANTPTFTLFATELEKAEPVINPPTGLAEELAGKLSLFPNPVSVESGYNLQLSSPLFAEQLPKLKLVDLAGKEVSIAPVFSENGKVEIPMAQLESGLYLLQIEWKGIVITKKVLK